ncbi:MAG: cache domain-containing protein [Synergistaceae bacterium]|nr:cache domain-containing protein [Synergistaceae bacterium]
MPADTRTPHEFLSDEGKKLTKLKIGGRVFLVTFILMLAGVTVASMISSFVFIEAMRDEMDFTLSATTSALGGELNMTFDNMRTRIFGQTLIDMEEMTELIEQNDLQELDKRMRMYLRLSGFDTLTLTDARGVVLCRPHTPNLIGDNISNKGYVQPTLRGQEAQVIEKGTTIELGFFYGMPIMKGDKIIGSLVAGINAENAAFIDYLADIYRAEVTFFYGDQRINTTLRKNGQRIVGTKTTPAVVEAVLNKGESYYGTLTLENGNRLRTLYKPFIFNEKRVGILAAGVSTHFLEYTIWTAVRRVTGSAVVFLLLAMGASYVFAKNITRLSSEKTKQEIFLNLLMKNTPDAILILDTDENLIDCSDVFLCRSWGDKPKKAGSGTFSQVMENLLNAEEIEQLRKIFAEAMRDKKSISLDKVIDFHQEDVLRSYTVRFSPIFDTDGATLGCVIMFHDLTDLQMAQHAEAALQAKSVFLANISHEIRTPLNAVIGLSSIELRNTLPQETHENLEKIYRSSGTLLNIINDILDISKIESGKFEIIPAEYDFANMISDTLHLNIVRLASKPVTFEPHVDDTIPTRLYGDELRVKQILNNILSNAFKYTQKGKVTLDISWERRENDAFFSFSVTDTGIGIKKEDIGKLFLEYNQLNTKAHHKIEGTGLGLSICKNLVDMMGGLVEVESEYGKGSRFTVRICQGIVDFTPIGQETALNLKTFRLIEHRGLKELVRTPMPYGKVLLVDDVVTNLDVAKGLMAPYGLTIHCATDGRQAIELVQEGKNRYDVIFMDHMMPGMDGTEVVRVIREEIGTEYAKTVPIIALTANATVGNEAMFLKSGFQAYLPKPIDVMLLDALLNEWIRDKRDQEAQEAQKAQEPKTRAEADLWIEGLSIEGLNAAAGCLRFGGENAYKEILRSYALYTPELLDKLRQVDEETLPDYVIAVHGLKGSSYGICAEKIGKMAEALELAAKNGDIATVKAKNGDLLREIESLFSDLRFLCEMSSEDEIESIERRSAPDASLLMELRQHCAHYDLAGMERILSELERYTYESQGELVEWLRKQVDDLEYERILERLGT